MVKLLNNNNNSSCFSYGFLLLIMIPISSILLLSFSASDAASTNNASDCNNKCELYRPTSNGSGEGIHHHHRVKRMPYGSQGDIRAMPWMIYVSAASLESWNPYFLQNCTGSLVSRRHVLSAAHCFRLTRMPNSSYTVTVHYGSANKNTARTVVLQKEAVHKHPNVSATIVIITNGTMLGYNENDVAIVDLGQDLELDDTVQPVCVACLNNATVPQGPAIIAGWGNINPNPFGTSIFPDIFKYQSVGIHQCNSQEYESADKICTQADQTHGFAGGDSGGPVLASYNNGRSFLQVGVINSNNLRKDQREQASNKVDRQWFEQITGIKCKNFPEEE